MGGDADMDLLYWLRETADEIAMRDDQRGDVDLETWASTVAFVDQHIGVQCPKLALAVATLQRLGHL